MAILGWLKSFGSAIGSQGQPVAVKDFSGNAIAIKASDDGEPITISKDHYLAISKGEIPGIVGITKRVYVSNVGSAGSPILLSENGYAEQSSGAQRSVVSDSPEDDLTTGTGAWRVRLEGLDNSDDEISENIDLDGTTAVDTVESYKHINKFEVIEAGSTGAAVGTITLKDTTGGGGSDIMAISPEGTHEQTAIFYVPSGKKLSITEIKVFTENKGFFQFRHTKKVGGYSIISKGFMFYTEFASFDGIRSPIIIDGPGKFEVYFQQTGTGTKLWSALFVGWLE